MNRMDVYGPADYWDSLPDGTTVGTTNSGWVAFALGYSQERFLFPEEAERLAALLIEAAKKVRDRNLTSSEP